MKINMSDDKIKTAYTFGYKFLLYCTYVRDRNYPEHLQNRIIKRS